MISLVQLVHSLKNITNKNIQWLKIAPHHTQETSKSDSMFEMLPQLSNGGNLK